jgi:starch phosphorylase
LNGALQFSSSDGWIDEVDIAPIGWRLADENSAGSLYDTLEQKIAPLFYERADTLPEEWIKMMRANIKLIEEGFAAERMLAEYYEKLYQ